MKFLIILVLVFHQQQLAHTQNTTSTTTKTTTTKKQECPLYGEFCKCDNILRKLECENFQTFSQLDFTSTPSGNFILSTIIIRPKEPLHLDDSLNLTGLQIKRSGKIQFENIKSISYTADPFKPLRKTNAYKLSELVILNSTFLFLNETTGQEIECDPSKTQQLQNSFLSFTNGLILVDVKFSRPLCPLIFWNVGLNRLNIMRPLNEANQPSDYKFINIQNKPVNFTLNCRVKYFLVENANFEQISAVGTFNSDIFRLTERVTIKNSNITKIDQNAFNHFTWLIELNFDRIENFQTLIVSTSTKWMAGLNSNQTIILQKNKNQNLNTRIFKWSIRNCDFNFSDASLCRFKFYPHANRVYLALDNRLSTRLECTSTLFWLLKNNTDDLVKRQTELLPSGLSNCDFSNKTWYGGQLKRWNFQHIFEQCPLDDDDLILEAQAVQSIPAQHVAYIAVGVIGAVLVFILSITVTYKLNARYGFCTGGGGCMQRSGLFQTQYDVTRNETHIEFEAQPMSNQAATTTSI